MREPGDPPPVPAREKVPVRVGPRGARSRYNSHVRAATIYDVARLAGVSHQTVTRFLHGYQGIRPETRSRVEGAIAELDYRPNGAARFLRSRTTNRIGVLADRIVESGPARILAGASDLARERGYVLDIAVAAGGSTDSVAASLAMITEHQVAGILATAQTQVVLEEMHRLALSIPLVVGSDVGTTQDGRSLNESAGRCAADHLLDLGHRRIGYVAGPELWLVAQERERGFTERVVERGGVLVWRRHGDWSSASGHAAWSGLTADERRVTAVGAANDSMAIGVVSAADEQHLRVPHDLSVVGTDDLPEARYVLPSLSTVALDFEGEGRLVLDALIAKIEGEDVPDPALLTPPRVIARASSAPLVAGV